MNKITIIDRIKTDKLKHFFLATAIAFILVNWLVLIGFWITIAILIGKEIVYDKILKKGTPSANDFLWGLAGALLIIITKIL